MISKVFRKAAAAAPPPPSVPADTRVYAIGDIHGCDEQFARILELIEADHAMRTPKRRVTILLGDLVDRGPASAAVVERARQLSMRDPDARFLAGNHEEMLLLSCAGDRKALKLFARNGGRETAISYGIDAQEYDAADFEELHRLLERAVPAAHRDFIAKMEHSIIVGGYAFVHAGIRPGVPLVEQRGEDLRWIRDRFLDCSDAHEKFIVHGHTITERVDEQRNRLGIDTGAYATGRLTAVALEGDRRWFLQS